MSTGGDDVCSCGRVDVRAIQKPYDSMATNDGRPHSRTFKGSIYSLKTMAFQFTLAPNLSSASSNRKKGMKQSQMGTDRGQKEIERNRKEMKRKIGA